MHRNSTSWQWEYARKLRELQGLAYGKFQTSCRDRGDASQVSVPCVNSGLNTISKKRERRDDWRLLTRPLRSRFGAREYTGSSMARRRREVSRPREAAVHGGCSWPGPSLPPQDNISMR